MTATDGREEPMRVGVVGCGNISGIYFKNLARYEETGAVACADLDPERAQAAARVWGLRACPPDELLRDPEVDLVLNLTVPKAHHSVAKAALELGKHVYGEKPLAVDRCEGRELVEFAAAKGLRLGCAPDTVLGAGIQTCRALIDHGDIGDPVGANAFMLCPGHESWHPAPEFYYEKGGGPLFDMGPYYLSALFTLLGPAKSVLGATRASFPTRTITSEPRRGKIVPVETPTHVVGVLELECGAIAQITTSFDVPGSTLPCIEVYGSEGSLLVPDPNGFGGEVRVLRKGTRDWETVPHTHPHDTNERGLGVCDMALALREGRPHRASGELAFHVLDVMHAVLEGAEQGRRMLLDSGPERPEPMPAIGARIG